MSKISQRFSAAAQTYDAHALLQQEVQSRLLEKLAFFQTQPDMIMDLGSGTGSVRPKLKKMYPKAQQLQVDIAHGMLKQAGTRASLWHKKPWAICSDVGALGLKSQSVDIVFSSLMIQWVNDLPRAFKEIYRVLKPGGLFVFSTLGPMTLYELKESLAVAGLSEKSVNLFADMMQVGDEVVSAGFVEPVFERESLVMEYEKFSDLRKDLKGLGANTALDSEQKIITKEQKNALEMAYNHYKREGILPATYDVIYGVAWKRELEESYNKEGVIPIFPDAI